MSHSIGCIYIYLISDCRFFILACFIQAVDDSLDMVSSTILQMVEQSVQQVG